jgi:dolichol-phosphate mannosyltransferase
MISVVIPCFNEEVVLPTLYSQLTKVAETWDEAYEVIICDDSSEDNTWAIINDIHKSDSRWKAIRFSRNFGQQMAISAGLKYAVGDCTVIMDADLQDPPEIIARFIKKWKKGYDVVYGIRANRKEGIFKRACYSGFYRVLTKIAKIKIQADSGDFCLMDRRIVEILNSMPERNRFIRGLRAWTGFKQAGIEYDRMARAGGRPKYTFFKLFKLAADGVFSFSISPIRLATYIGLFVSFISFLAAILIFFWRIFSDYDLPGYATTILSILFLGGIQLIAMGVIGEYIGRIYDEVKKRPPWIEEQIIGFDREEQ